MKKNIYLFFLFVVMLLISFNCRRKEIEPNKPAMLGSISGHVYNEFNQSLQGATIKIKGEGKESKFTSKTGDFKFEKLTIGNYVVSVSDTGYLDISTSIIIKDETNIELDIFLKPGQAYLQLSDSIKNVSYQGGGVEISIESNTTWALQKTADWLTINKNEGQGSDKIVVQWSNNETDFPRNGTLEFTSGNINKIFSIAQSNKLQVIQYYGIFGNQLKGEVDSIYIQFNKEIKVKQFVNKYTNCMSDYSPPIYTDNVHGFRVAFPCGSIGETSPIEVQVEAIDGTILREALQIPFYSKRLDIDGYIYNHFIDEEENSLWIVTATPNKVYQVAIDDFTIKASYTLSSQPNGSFALNEQANELYVVCNNASVQVLDTKSGSLKRTLFFETDDSHDIDIPQTIIFTKNGLGIITFGSNTHSGFSWKMIDSRNNDTIYEHPQYGYGDNKYSSFIGMYLNYDKTKLLMNPRYGIGADIAILDQYTEAITVHRPPFVDNIEFMRPNRKNNNVFVAGLYHQYLIDPIKGTNGVAYTNLDARSDPSSDFSYKEGEMNIVYYLDENFLRVSDYDNVAKKASFKVAYGLRGATTTPNGQYLIFRKSGISTNSNGTVSRLFQISTNKF